MIEIEIKFQIMIWLELKEGTCVHLYIQFE